MQKKEMRENGICPLIFSYGDVDIVILCYFMWDGLLSIGQAFSDHEDNLLKGTWDLT